jgi:hypothetical protein
MWEFEFSLIHSISESKILEIAWYVAKDVKVCNNGNVSDRLR